MNPYICVTYAHEDRELSDHFCRGLERYGFRYSCMNELGETPRRVELLNHAELLIALTSPAAVHVETVASDIRHALEHGLRVLCVSMEENELDHRFCTGSEGGAALIPSPTGDTTDHHAAALFIHRLFVRYFTAFSNCFMETRCADDLYGQVIRCAYYAHHGDGEACFELGRAYELGVGVPALEKEAAHWLRRSAEQDVCDALVRMGQFLLSGKGVERDDEAACANFRRAMELGDVRGWYWIGLCYLNGTGVLRDAGYAVECLQKAAERRYAPALYRLAILCRDGVGAERNPRAALRYLYAACCCPVQDTDDGDGESVQTNMPLTVYGYRPGIRYICVTMRQMRHVKFRSAGARSAARQSKASADRSFGRNTVRESILPEDRWAVPLSSIYGRIERGNGKTSETHEKAADIYISDWTRADLALAAFELGRLLSDGDKDSGLYPSPTRALVWYRYAARLGYTDALYHLGDAYRRGYGTPADTGRAVALFRLASDCGSEVGQFAYAICCERGIGRRADPFEAARLYEQAAEAGYPPAQNNLGGCYEYGIGVAQNMLAAVEWYAAAANENQPDALCRLGVCYEMGRGVPIDKEKAIRLYESAAELGQAYALYRLALCYDGGAEADAGDETSLSTDASALVTVSADDPDVPLFGKPGTSETFLKSGPDQVHATELYRRAAEGGVPEAAYALYLCHCMERGLSRNERSEIFYLKSAAERNCLQACYELGLCYMEGRGLPKDTVMAVNCFAHAIALWRARTEDARWYARTLDREPMPPESLSLKQAAGGALYMLGYCTLYGIGETGNSSAAEISESERVDRAVALFREAADIEHAGSMIMLGDLYAFGVVSSENATAEDESLDFYLDAVHTSAGGYDRGVATRDRTDRTIDAFMSLAVRATRVAEEESDEGNAEMARVNAWRSYSECAARGSADALIGMAECLFYGHGSSSNTTAAVRMLRRAESLHDGRILASLWLGDYLRSRWEGQQNPVDPAEAAEVYIRGLRNRYVESECSPYTLENRRKARKQADVRARVEILYRLATLRAMYGTDESGGTDPRYAEAFRCLAEAILMGHAEARDDLARIFAYEMSRPRGLTRKANRSKRMLESRFGAKARLRRRMRDFNAIPTRNNRALRLHRTWLNDYYTALWPEPVPFSYEMKATTLEGDAPDYVKAPVTDLMRINAMQYLGECFFEGYGVPADAAAAVACYRAVRDMAPESVRAIPSAVIEATYSLGWCLLYGVGTTVNYPEAIRLLTQVSKTHVGACYTLGVCHEEGRGVVVADDREAIKYYRKAQKLGHNKAAAKVAMLEKRLQNHSNPY